jgi:RNA polymerase sigma factor for flagellar operon FliA
VTSQLSEKDVEVALRVARYLPLVKRLAHYQMSRLPKSIELDDMIQAGCIGLLDAARRFKPDKGAKFETYAVQRIKGAMLDALRESDWMPRTTRNSLRKIQAMIERLEQKYSRIPTDREVAAGLKLTLKEFQELLLETCGEQFESENLQGVGEESYIERNIPSEQPGPLDILLDKERMQLVVGAIEELSERDSKVMDLLYVHDLNLREAGETIGVSESRVCQLHDKIIKSLTAKLTGKGAQH